MPQMVDPWPFKPFIFRALAKTFGQMWLRCDVCRRYAQLRTRGLLDVAYREKTFSCSRCGAEAYIAVVEPVRETGMGDYRLDEIGQPVHHPRCRRSSIGRPRPLSPCKVVSDYDAGTRGGRGSRDKMTSAYTFPPGRAPEVWEIVDAKTGKKMAGDVLRSHDNSKLTAWMYEGSSQRPIVAETFEELSVRLEAYYHGSNDGFPRRARLKFAQTTCGELARGDWVQLYHRGLLSSHWENGAREVLSIKPINRTLVQITLPKNDDKSRSHPMEFVERRMSDVCYVLYVDDDFPEWHPS